MGVCYSNTSAQSPLAVLDGRSCVPPTIVLIPVMRVLPAELWIQIIRELPSHYQRSCLSVSRLFHDISLQYVFASINIRLGLLKDNYLADKEEWHICEVEEQVEAEIAMRRSYELLRHVVRSPRSSLTQTVRNVSVRAYSYRGKSPPKELLGMSDRFYC